MKFKELNLIEPILRAVDESGYDEPTPIQAQAIPPLLSGRDLLGCAQTGSGKTAAFSLPILQNMYQNRRRGERKIRALILTPTRELAAQIQDCFVSYGKYLPLKSVVIFGGVNQKPQTERLRQGCDILIATPGRLLDLISQGYVHLDGLEYFVLDEADRMLDMGFIHDIRKVMDLLPQKRQTLLFSATMPDEVEKIVDTLLDDPVKVAVTPVSSTVDTVNQKLYYVDKTNKRHLLTYILNMEHISSALVFTRTKHMADRVAKHLRQSGITCDAIHGDKSQHARETALKSFKDWKIQVLVATDIAARGIDIVELSHVINYDMPDTAETYVHRIGRTARAGQTGTAISFCDIVEKPMVKEIEKLIRKKIDVVEEHPFPMEVLAPPPKLPRPPRPEKAEKPLKEKYGDQPKFGEKKPKKTEKQEKYWEIEKNTPVRDDLPPEIARMRKKNSGNRPPKYRPKGKKR